jgi:hypothetical protein
VTHDVFISYSHIDQLSANAACATLEATGLRCWIAPRDISPGAEWAESIIEAIDHCSIMVLIFSSNANESQQVRREVERAVNSGLTIMPVRVDPSEPVRSLAYFIAGVHWLDAMTPPLEQHLQRLANSINALLETGPRGAGREVDEERAESRETIERPQPSPSRTPPDPQERQNQQHPQNSRHRRFFDWRGSVLLVPAAALLVVWASVRAPMSPGIQSIVVRPDGEADVAMRRPNNALRYSWASPGSPWSTIEIAAIDMTLSKPAIAVRGNGEADIVAMGPNNSLLYYWATPGSAWGRATIAGADTTYSAPAIAVRATGEADIVATGPDKSLLYYWATPGSVWAKATIASDGTTYSAPAIAVRGNGEADIVAMGPNNSLLYYWATPGSVWAKATIASDGTTYSAPAIAVRGNGEADIVATGPNNSLLYYWATPGSAWAKATIASDGTTYSAPAIAVRGNGEADIVAMGPDKSLLYYWATPGAAWQNTNILAPQDVPRVGGKEP